MSNSRREDVYRITSAQVPLSEDVEQRERRYLASMAVRTLCFIGAVLAFAVFDQPAIGGVLLAGSLLLPYIAVVVANAGRERSPGPPRTVITDPRQGLTEGESDRAD